MALTANIETNEGVVVRNAYCRVEQIAITKTHISFVVKSYVDPEKFKKFFEKSYVCNYDLSGANAIAQAYGHLKTLPEFTGASDC
jgi:hypothetical protein